MVVDTDYLVSMTEANQNFSKVVRIVDESGLAVILKNNKPRYIVVDFDEYNNIAAVLQMHKLKSTVSQINLLTKIWKRYESWLNDLLNKKFYL